MALIPTVAAFPLQRAFIPLLEALTAGCYANSRHSSTAFTSTAASRVAKPFPACPIWTSRCCSTSQPIVRRYSALRRRQAFQLEQRIVSKVDFDIGSVDEALAPEHHDSWGFWLKHHCRCLWGEDRPPLFRCFSPIGASRWRSMPICPAYWRVIGSNCCRPGRYRMRGA